MSESTPTVSGASMSATRTLLTACSWPGPLFRRAPRKLTFTQTGCGAKVTSLASWRTHTAGQKLTLVMDRLRVSWLLRLLSV